MPFYYLLLSLFVACAFSTLGDKDSFNLWKSKYNKTYATPLEESMRFTNFRASLERIKKHSLGRKGGAVMGLTKFSDMSVEEFRSTILMKNKIHPQPHAPRQVTKLKASPPIAFDWRAQGLVTPVKDQEQCGSCWAFSATETIESAYMMKHNLTNATMQPLAPQQIVDCDWYCLGCNGGQSSSALNYVMGAGGLETNAAYPYQGENGQCDFDATQVYAKVASWDWACSILNEGELRDNTYKYGPTSICVDAQNWQDYQSGVMTAWQCAWINALDHCVQAVGWNLKASPPYWIVRNSWSTEWGENGFIRLEFGTNTCGLTYDATYVISE